MKISIIVPVYNVENYLVKCLDSLVNQTYENIEILCVNDGSTDNSLLILSEYAKKYPAIIRVLNKKNGGLADARNYGLDNATGEYIGFVDSDDWVHLSMYENMLKKALVKSAEIVVCDYTEVYNEKQVLVKDENGGYKILYESLVCNKLFKKSLFEDPKVRFPLGLWYEDNATTYKLLFLANKVEKEDKSYYFYRRTRPNSIMNSQNSSRIYDMNSIGKELYKFFSNYELNEDIRQQVEYIFIKNIFFRQVPKILKYEFPNVINMKKKMKEHFRNLENYFPRWYENKIFIEDKDRYFYNKIGKSHVKKIQGFKKSLISIAITVVFK